jgi:hypothetical protein
MSLLFDEPAKEVLLVLLHGPYSQNFLQTSYDQYFRQGALLTKWRGLFKVNHLKIKHLFLKNNHKKNCEYHPRVNINKAFHEHLMVSILDGVPY